MDVDKNNSEHGSSHSWWLDCHNRPYQSQWLQATLSELDKKIKMMLNLIEDDGDTFAKRAEMFYKNRPQLIESVEELHRSYRALAEKYDQVRPESIRAISNLSRDITSTKYSHHEVFSVSDNSNLDYDDFRMENLEREKMWNEMRVNVSKLIEDNLKQQTELIRRNNEKREAIKELCVHRNKLVSENKDLKSDVSQTKTDIKRNRSQISRVKDIILKKLLP